MKAIIAVAMMVASAAAYGGELLKCVEKDGKVEYADRCQPGTTEQKIGVRSSAGGSSPSAPPQQKSLAERDAEFRKRLLEQQETQQKAEKKSAEADQRREACESAQTYLKSLQAENRISRVDPRTGERVYLEDADRPAEIAKAQRAVDQNCK